MTNEELTNTIDLHGRMVKVETQVEGLAKSMEGLNNKVDRIIYGLLGIGGAALLFFVEQTFNFLGG